MNTTRTLFETQSSLPPAYRSDLAHIHDAGFGQLARHAAGVLLGELQRGGQRGGTVVDLGCGSGITAELLVQGGCRVVGIDLSESMIEVARRRVAQAQFRVGSFVTAQLPAGCAAVTAIGEVFNYAFDPANGAAARAATLARIHAVLAPGGLLLFDMAGPQRAPAVSPQRSFAEGDDWAVLVEAEADSARTWLMRRITSFRQVGELYRRDTEVHRLQLVGPEEVVAALRQAGFDEVRTASGYGALALPPGLTVFLARKPG